MRLPRLYEPLVGFRSEKAAQIAAYFLAKSGHAAEILKLTKLLYLAERESIRVRHRPMMFDEYYSLPHGPVCSCAMNGLNGRIDKNTWHKYI
ncbi:MAG: Panacea domain-containing protein, partial [Roseiarcus sp.]